MKWTTSQIALLQSRYPLDSAKSIAKDLGLSEKQVYRKALHLGLKKDAAHWKPIGHERIATNGYLERRVTQTGDTLRDYRPVHHLVWQGAGNTLAEGQALVFKDGDKTNVSLDNLEAISRTELLQRNSVHRYGPEIAQLYQLQGAITRQINLRMRQK
jgi:hypothetical protein